METQAVWFVVKGAEGAGRGVEGGGGAGGGSLRKDKTQDQRHSW